jgi:membrane-bound lytic murein transglycosylase MltF
MNTRRLLLLLVFLLLVSLLIIRSLSVFVNGNAAKPVRDLPEIRENNTLNVVTEYNSVDFHVSGDSVAGFQYDLCRYLADCSGLTIHIFFENDLGTAIRKLENNVYDVIAQNIPVTNENRQILAFTVPVTQSRQVLVQRKRDDADSVLFIASQLDLANQTIHITNNSPAIMRLRHLSEEIAEPIHIEEITGYTSEQLIYMVAKKEINYTVTDREIALKNIRLFPELDFNTDISFTQLQAWALRKSSPVLLDSLNVWITAYKQAE